MRLSPWIPRANDDMAAVGQIHFDRASLTGVVRAEEVAVSEEALVRAAQGGDRSAFGALYHRYSRMVHGILLARVPRVAAEDLLQDVFLQALPRLASLRYPVKFGGWLAAIARNRANDYHRQEKPTEEWSEVVRSDNSGPADTEQLSDGLFLLEAVRSLPEAYRETLILRFVEGMTGPEIAQKTGLKHGSVRVNLYRGVQLLREKLKRS